MEAARDITPRYQQRSPADTTLFKVLAGNIETFIAQREAAGNGLPSYVVKELKGFLECGIIQHGFIRCKCEDCGFERAVPYSCKGRGFCPSCGAKRMAETAAHLVDNVLPEARYRQWIVTLPIALRYWVATNRLLMGQIHKIITGTIIDYYEHRAKEDGIANSKGGFVTFIQYFGSALQLTPHLHVLAVDGVFTKAKEEDKPVYHRLKAPATEEVGEVLNKISKKVIGFLQGEGYLNEEFDVVDRPDIDPIFAEHPDLAASCEASIHLKVAFGERAGQKVRKIGKGFGFIEEIPLAKGEKIAQVNGFTIHAARRVKEYQRDKLEELITYMGRPSLSSNRLIEREDGNLEYLMKREFSDGTASIILSPLELCEKLVAIIPVRGVHLVRYGGVFAPNHSWRKDVVRNPNVKKGWVKKDKNKGDEKRYVKNTSWSRLLARVFKIDVSTCPKCSGEMIIKGALRDREEIARYLKHEGIPTDPPPIAPARYEQEEFDFGSDPPE